MRTLLVGLDAACERVLDPLFEADAVPTLERLFASGASGRLESQIPPWTASAWPSLYTGTNPGKHGVFGFLSFDGYDHDVVDATDVRQPPLWQLLDHLGYTSVVVNVPVTYPTAEFDGALVPGYTAPDTPPCHPRGLLADVEDAVGEYRVYADDEGTDVDDRTAQLEELRELAALRGATFEYLLERFDPEFGFLQFQVTDTVCHQFPGDHDAIQNVYAAVDEALAGVLDSADPGTVCVASDHGIGPCERRVAPNEVLREGGLVESDRSAGGMPDWASIRDSDLRGDEDDDGGAGLRMLTGLATVAARAGVTAQRVGWLARQLGVADLLQEQAPDALVRSASERVDFAASTAYARSRVECGVRLNLQGREPDGVVPPDEYETVRSDVAELLGAMETESGDPVFETVVPREDVFEGPHVEDAVDVVAVPRNFESAVTTWLTGERVEPFDGPQWDHRRGGIVALHGAGVEETTPVEGAHLFDVAPTVLATMGAPAAKQMDGSVLGPVESAGTREYPVQAATGTSGDADETVEDHLSAMGYLE